LITKKILSIIGDGSADEQLILENKKI